MKPWLKRLLIVLFALLAFLLACYALTVIDTRSAYGVECVGGDVNRDGEVDLEDIDYLVQYIFLGGPEPVDCIKPDFEIDMSLWDQSYFLTADTLFQVLRYRYSVTLDFPEDTLTFTTGYTNDTNRLGVVVFDTTGVE